MRHVQGPANSRDSRGEPYMTLVGLSVKPEGEPIAPGQICDSPAQAWGDFLSAFAEITDGQDAVEWRAFPELLAAGNRFAVRARFTTYKDQTA